MTARQQAEIERLREMLREANEAFDECTGDYSKDLVKREAWRRYRRRHLQAVSS